MMPPPAVKAKALNCPQCGAAMQIRGFDHSLTVVCPQCLSILDAKDPNLKVLQVFAGKIKTTPLIPLGSRGNWRGVVYEVIGFQLRNLESGGVTYHWSEYLLFNPYHGFRYLTEYAGHWNFVRTVQALPQPGSGIRPSVRLDGATFRHFSTYGASTSFVLGEFPWQVRHGDKAALKDFICVPQILSAESTSVETTWSVGEYASGGEIWKSFKLPGKPPAPEGVFANQPSPFAGKVKSMWRLFSVLLLLALAGAIGVLAVSRDEEVFRQRYRFAPARSEASFVTPTFELKGRRSNVNLSIHTDLSNNWAYFNFALINEDSGQAYDFGREVSYYSGRDSDGNWSEGGRNSDVLIPDVPSGRYYLRVEPEMDKNADSVDYDISIRRDVPHLSLFFWLILLLLIPPILTMIRAASFESRRWRESDYAPATSGGDD